MHLFNQATPANTPTSTHVAHIALWLLLLQLAKMMLFSFLKDDVLSVYITFIKKVWTPTIGKILGLVREPANDHT